jgi:hypothetical protein
MTVAARHPESMTTVKEHPDRQPIGTQMPPIARTVKTKKQKKAEKTGKTERCAS